MVEHYDSATLSPSFITRICFSLALKSIFLQSNPLKDLPGFSVWDLLIYQLICLVPSLPVLKLTEIALISFQAIFLSYLVSLFYPVILNVSNFYCWLYLNDLISTKCNLIMVYPLISAFYLRGKTKQNPALLVPPSLCSSVLEISIHNVNMYKLPLWPTSSVQNISFLFSCCPTYLPASLASRTEFWGLLMKLILQTPLHKPISTWDRLFSWL